MSNVELRRQVKQLYKTLLYMGRDWPKGYTHFRDRCHNAFMKNKDVTDPEQIKKLISHGEYVVKEIEALYYLKKYRTLKRRYYDSETSDSLFQNFESKYSNGGK